MNPDHEQAAEYAEELSRFSFHGLRVPARMRDPLILYLVWHEQPGSFLTAVLTNNLAEACFHADDENIKLLHVYAAFLYNHAPAASWGSPEAVEQWLSQ